jgi:hypothetical protein
MAFTRFYDDPDRIMKKLQESTDPGMYYLNQPGNGDRPHYIKDPSIIMQKWGANLHHDRVGVESELLGMNYTLTRDKQHTPFTSTPITYPTYSKEVTVQSRTIAPVWTARDLEQSHRWILPLDPQEHVIPSFDNNISTRVLEKNKMVNV